MEKKLNKRFFYNALLEKAEKGFYIDEKDYTEEVKEFLLHEIQLLDNKTKRKISPEVQKLNDDLKEYIIEGFNTLGNTTLAEVKKHDERLKDFSSQKLSALINQLINEGKMIRVEGKRSHFALAE